MTSSLLNSIIIKQFYKNEVVMGLHALALYVNAHLSIVRVVFFTISVSNVSTWFLGLGLTVILMVHIYS